MDNGFAEINEHLDLEYFFERESLGYHLSRGSSGMQINAKECPACGDRRNRVYLNAETGRGNCFVCNETFSKVKFVKLSLDLDNWAEVFRTCREIMREQGWRPKRVTPVAVEVGDVVLPYSYPLPLEDGSNLVYLENRGITEDYCRYFGLRWCEYGFWAFKDEEGNPRKQKFDNRVIIPVFDLDGTLKTFQGRDLAPPQSKEDIAAGAFERQKYLFPKMLPGTGRYLYNGHNVVRCKEVCVGEGAFDVAAIKIAFDEDVNLRNVVPVGTFGKHLSYGSVNGDDQLGRFLQLKRDGVTTVTIMWDGEVKALVSALDACKLLASIGLKARVALLPFGKDPNEVTGDVVRQAYYAAQVWTPMLDVKLRLRNPYADAAKRKTAKPNGKQSVFT